MEFQEYPKRVYRDDESIIVNTIEEESEFLEYIPIKLILKIPKEDIANDKKNEEGMQGSLSQGEESRGIENDGGMQGEIKGSGNVQAHEGQEGTPGVLTTCEDLQIATGMTKEEIIKANKIAENIPIKRKAGRPKKREMDERGFVPK